MLLSHALRAATPKGLQFTYRGTSTFGAGATATYTNFSIGTASSDRVVFVAAWMLSATARSISSITIGGVTATLVVGDTATRNQNVVLYRATVPTGTTATIVVTWSGSANNSGIDVWTASGVGTITTFSSNRADSNATTQSVTINTPSNGFSIASGFRYRGATTTITNSGSLAFTTNRYTTDASSAWIDGSVNPTSAVTGQVYTIIYSATSTSNTTFLAASFSF